MLFYILFRKQANLLTKTCRDGSPKIQTRRTILMLTRESLWSYMTWSLPPLSLCFTMLQLSTPVSVSRTCQSCFPQQWPVLSAWDAGTRSSHDLLPLLPQVIQVSVQQGSFKTPSPCHLFIFFISFTSVVIPPVFAFVFCLSYQTVSFVRARTWLWNSEYYFLNLVTTVS